MKAESVPEAVELMKNSDPRGIAAVTEHGARVSRTPKQKSKRKATIRKPLKAKSQASNRAKKPHKSQRAKTEGKSLSIISIKPIRKRNRAII